jgi:hypothetical protein
VADYQWLPVTVHSFVVAELTVLPKTMGKELGKVPVPGLVLWRFAVRK